MEEKTVEGIDSADKEPDYEFLDPKKLCLFRDDSGRVMLTVEGDRSYPEVKVVRAFPLSDSEHYIGFLDKKDRVIGLVIDIKEFEPGPGKIVVEELDRRYFTPDIERIYSLKEEFGVIYCDVETNYGRRQFVAKGIRDSMEEMGDGELLLADVDGNRYRIADWRQMDVRSRTLLERIV